MPKRSAKHHPKTARQNQIRHQEEVESRAQANLAEVRTETATVMDQSQAVTPRPKFWSVVGGLTKYTLRASLKNKAGLFFSFVFPLVFVAVFGLLGSDGNRIKIGLPTDGSLQSAIGENRVIEALTTLANQSDSPLELVKESQSELEKRLSQDKLAGIVLPVDQSITQIKLLTSNSSPQGKAQATSLVNGLMSQLNLATFATGPLPFQVETAEISGKEFRYIDFALPGQIGFSLLSLATFGVAFGMITLRETLVLKRIFATTVRPIQFVLALVLSRSFQAVLQAAAIIVIGVLAFDFTLQGGWIGGLSMLALSFLGILTFVGFGILISNLAKDENTLPIALNIFNLPQFLLSGVFFPIDDMPATVRLIGNNLPLSYLNIALRKVSIEGLSLFEVWPYILGLLGWAIISYLLAAKTFKTE